MANDIELYLLKFLELLNLFCQFFDEVDIRPGQTVFKSYGMVLNLKTFWCLSDIVNELPYHLNLIDLGAQEVIPEDSIFCGL